MHVILADRLIISKKFFLKKVGNHFRLCIEHVLVFCEKDMFIEPTPRETLAVNLLELHMWKL